MTPRKACRCAVALENGKAGDGGVGGGGGEGEAGGGFGDALGGGGFGGGGLGGGGGEDVGALPPVTLRVSVMLECALQ